MAKPNKTLPTKTVRIQCGACQTLLFKYKKGGKGALIKCFVERIIEDHTQELGICPQCQQQFGRAAMIRGVPAIKIIGQKARQK